jgi:hypothetical protein
MVAMMIVHELMDYVTQTAKAKDYAALQAKQQKLHAT